MQETNGNVPTDFQDLWATKWMSPVIAFAKRDESAVIQHYLKELEHENDQTNGKQTELYTGGWPRIMCT